MLKLHKCHECYIIFVTGEILRLSLRSLINKTLYLNVNVNGQNI